MPAKAGIQKTLKKLDSRFRGNDKRTVSIRLRCQQLSVMPAKAGIQKTLKKLDSRFRGNDKRTVSI
jgi:hypothetical protein